MPSGLTITMMVLIIFTTVTIQTWQTEETRRSKHAIIFRAMETMDCPEVVKLLKDGE